ncbi:MAG: rtbF, partial [Hyphomicrobiales bacterium]|nr:rtbF [Hyphomicrobiales bacterium]
YSNDVHIDLASGAITALSEEKTDWKITLVDTGATALTGTRVKRAAKFVKDDKFFVTYGDGVSNIDIGQLLEFHNAEGKNATVTAVRPPSRFGELLLDEGVVRSFVEKPQTGAGWINGGFFVFNTDAVRALPDHDDLSLERDVLESMAADRQLSVFKHAGFWQCMDTYREMQILNEMWASGAAPWKTT